MRDGLRRSLTFFRFLCRKLDLSVNLVNDMGYFRLDVMYIVRNRLNSVRTFFGKLADFVSDDREAMPMFSSSCRFN